MSTKGSVVYDQGFHAWRDTNEDDDLIWFDARPHSGGGLKSTPPRPPKEVEPVPVCLTNEEMDILAIGWLRYRLGLGMERDG